MKIKISISIIIVSLLILILNINFSNKKDEISTTQNDSSEKQVETTINTEPIVITTEEETMVTSNGYYITSTITTDEDGYSTDYITYQNRFIPFYKKQISFNYNTGIIIEPEYIVIHETANTATGADAYAHYRYWNSNPDAYASAHFVVDDNKIYQMLKLNQSAWHVGDNDGYSDITNYNSIGIEIAVNQDGDYSIARQNAIDLTINIMKYLDMDISQLKRHYDASGKNCPTIMLEEPELWEDFVAQVAQGLNED